MSGRRPGTCGEPGPYAAHCTLDRMHDYSCYDAGEDVSWNEGQWYDFDLAPHDCGDETCHDIGYRGPPGRESEYEPTAPTARDLADATDLTSIAKFGTVVPRTDEQIAGDELLGQVFSAAAADFDRQMAKVQAVIDSGPSNLAALRLAAEAMGRPCIADQDPGLWGDQA